MIWRKYDDTKPPKSGSKIIFACDDGCSAMIAMVVDADGEGGTQILCAEDAMELDTKWLKGALWAELPEDYTIAFTQEDETDWF